jgi:hypothetical protein
MILTLTQTKRAVDTQVDISLLFNGMVSNSRISSF